MRGTRSVSPATSWGGGWGCGRSGACCPALGMTCTRGPKLLLGLQLTLRPPFFPASYSVTVSHQRSGTPGARTAY
ncbi:hypothetical protein FA95DRAFT_786188 [Auriscalpium vulgare]|uniref:Uncharacterized protein n=1 Tax=Auriscalpium vulgare TaxID=40419 RepID=A0ACB8RA28_9AGAM|nr:hypothetical protein FA95DRAFT_786188 [Auriscalpium vulgare]